MPASGIVRVIAPPETRVLVTTALPHTLPNRKIKWVSDPVPPIMENVPVGVGTGVGVGVGVNDAVGEGKGVRVGVPVGDGVGEGVGVGQGV